MPGRALLVTLATVLVVGGTTAAVLVGGEDARCAPGADGQHVRLSGPQEDERRSRDLDSDAVVDAAGARWHGRESYPLVVGGGEGICVSGGSIRGTWPETTSWRTMHGTAGVIAEGPRPTVEDIRIADYGDGIRFVDRAQDWEVRRVRLSGLRDDCVENDWLYSGVVRDALLDGCYNAFSARTYDGQGGVPDGSGNVMTIQNSLVRLQPMARTYDDSEEPGTAGFFKWDPRGPRLVLEHNVFRADKRAASVGLGIPRRKLESCEDNVMVWLGRGPYPGRLPRCFTITRDAGVWDRAVAEWAAERRGGLPHQG